MTPTDPLLARLADAGVVVVGGLAAVLHGASVVTADLDVCYAPTDNARKRLAVALAPTSPYPRGIERGLPFVWDERTLESSPLLTLMTAEGDVDLLTAVPGVGGYDAVRERSVAMRVGGTNLRVLALDALIDAKRAMGRPKDLLVLPELEAIRALR